MSLDKFYPSILVFFSLRENRVTNAPMYQPPGSDDLMLQTCALNLLKSYTKHAFLRQNFFLRQNSCRAYASICATLHFGHIVSHCCQIIQHWLQCQACIWLAPICTG